MAKVIGIDLGTSNSAAAVMEAGRPVIIPSAEGAGVASGNIRVRGWTGIGGGPWPAMLGTSVGRPCGAVRDRVARG